VALNKPSLGESPPGTHECSVIARRIDSLVGGVASPLGVPAADWDSMKPLPVAAVASWPRTGFLFLRSSRRRTLPETEPTSGCVFPNHSSSRRRSRGVNHRRAADNGSSGRLITPRPPRGSRRGRPVVLLSGLGGELSLRPVDLIANLRSVKRIGGSHWRPCS
jgi:hypothetical protein